MVGGDVSIGSTTLAHVRKVVYNVAYSATKGTRKVGQQEYADYFLSMFDYLMTLDDYDEKSAAKIVEFGAEQLRRASGQDGQ